MTYIVDEMSEYLDLITEEGCGDTCCGTESGVCNCPKPCDCGPECPCHIKEEATIDDVMEENMNEDDVVRMRELAGMTEMGHDDDDYGPSTHLQSELQGNPRDVIEIFNSRAGGMVAEQLANILGYDYKFSVWGGDGEHQALEKQNSSALKQILEFLRDRGEDDVANEIDEYLHSEPMEEDGYDYREMSKPEPNDFDRTGMDWDAFAKKGHLRKSKKRVNNYGDNPMAEEKVTEETDEDGNWIKPWEKDKADDKDDKDDKDTEEVNEETDEDGNWIKPWEKDKAEDKDDDKDDNKEEVDESIDNELFEKLLNEYQNFKLDEAVSQWIIMNATKKVFGKIRMSLDEIISSEWFDNGCVMVINFDHGQHAFVYGSGNSPYGVVGETRNYVQDTGKGYGRRGQLEIENFVCVSDGEIMTTANSTGLNEKRALWVFK